MTAWTKIGRSMRWGVEFSAPLTATLFAMTGVGFYLTFVTLLFAHRGYSAPVLGVVQAAYFLGLFWGAWTLERLIRRVGHIQVLALSGSMLVASILIQGLFENLFIWGSTRFFAGIAMAAFYVVIECWMLDHASPKQRGFALSLYMFALNMGYAAGQQVVPQVSLNTDDGFIIAGLLVALSVIPIALSTRKLTIPQEGDHLKVKSLVKASPFGTTCCFVSGAMLSALYSFLALSGHYFQTTGSQLVATMIMGGLISQWPLGKLSDMIDRRWILLVLCVAVVIASVFLSINGPGSVWVTYSLVFLLGLAVFTIYPISLTHVTDHLAPEQLAAGTARMLLVYGAGSIAGPLLAPLFLEYSPSSGLFIYTGIAGVLAMLVGFNSLIRRDPVAPDDKEDFIPLPRTTAVAYELDPRIDDSV